LEGRAKRVGRIGSDDTMDTGVVGMSVRMIVCTSFAAAGGSGDVQRGTGKCVCRDGVAGWDNDIVGCRH